MAQSTTSQYSQFYQMLSGPAPSNHIITPRKYDITGNEPSSVLFSNQGLPVNYPQYASNPIYTGSNTLWIQGLTSWTRYAQVPQGSSLALLATSSTGGNGYLYEINPSEILAKNGFYFFPGNSQIGFYADTVGQHILLFITNGQVSNSVVIDVVDYTSVYQSPLPIPTYPQGTIPPPGSTPVTTKGDSTVTIVSQGMKGYQVFLDGSYIGTEGTFGEPLDGKFMFRVVGNQNHDIRVYNGQFNYQKTMFFERDGTKTINVEPGTAVYN